MRDWINDWPSNWPSKSLIYREGFQAGYRSRVNNVKSVDCPYIDSQKDAWVDGFYHGQTESIARVDGDYE